jgi:chromosome segregation protein
MIDEGLESLDGRIVALQSQAEEYETKVVKRDTDGAAKVAAVKELLDAIAEKKGLLKTIISQHETEKLKQSDEIAELTQAYYRVEGAHARIDVTTEQMQIRMDEEYQMNYSACHLYLQEQGIEKIAPENLEESTRQVSAFKRKISALGPVNLDAIEQSKSAKERYDEYMTQVNDLQKAKTDLEKVIKDLNSEMVTKFRESFEQINKNFGHVFKELFGGGHARLELVPIGGDENTPGKIDWLESGIDIIAEPPGKKLANLTLLSGGEKALTAIAILFAILKLRPMPFCILDEIEAALDEANVSRFANYLLKFSAQTQFIVITHRKGTMELANNMYGVTMEERGISKLVSVKLESWDEAAAPANIAYDETGEVIHA